MTGAKASFSHYEFYVVLEQLGFPHSDFHCIGYIFETSDFMLYWILATYTKVVQYVRKITNKYLT